MATKAKESRVERYYNNAMELKKSRRWAMIARAACVVIAFVDWTGGMIINYQNEELGSQPIFWVIIVAILAISLIGVLVSHNKYKKINPEYLEAVKRYEMLIANNNAQ